LTLHERLVVAFVFAVFAAACVAASVTHLVAVEVLHVIDVMVGMVAVVGIWAVVAIIGMVVIVDMAVEVFGAVIPRAGTDKDAAAEPLWTVVAVGSAAVGGGVVVAVGTVGRDTDGDADLRVCLGSMCCKAETGDCGCCKNFSATHMFTSAYLERRRRGGVVPRKRLPKRNSTAFLGAAEW
jgi:hypothetical protein